MYSRNKLYDNFVCNLKSKMRCENKDIVFLCIGTNKIAGDCFGPLVGSKLKKILNRKKNIKIIGDMNTPINKKNINKVLKYMNKESYIIAIDAAISEFDIIGDIFVTNTGIAIGSGINKNNIKIGDLGIKACIGKDYNNKQKNIKSLNKISKTVVNELSQIVSLGIKEVCADI